MIEVCRALSHSPDEPRPRRHRLALKRAIVLAAAKVRPADVGICLPRSATADLDGVCARRL
jgi:hypothetical protein